MPDLIVGIVTEGLIYGILALGTYISYKILDFPDLSCDGTFPLGAAITTLIISSGGNPWLCLILSFLAGLIAGCITGFLNVKLKIKDLLCGILTMTLLYSVNYRIVGKPNEFLIGKDTIFSFTDNLFPLLGSSYSKIITIFVIVVVVKLIFDWYMRTKSGFLLRSVGDNPQLVVTLAKNPGKTKILGLAISNGLIALAGAINCQSTLAFNVSGGTGKVVMGLAAVIIGTTVFKKLTFMKVTTAVVLGMIVYKACISVALNFGFEASDLNMIVTVLFVLTLVLNNFMSGKRSDNIA